MTWNPLKRNNLTCKPSPACTAITKTDDQQLEEIFVKLQRLEEHTKKLQKELKKYLDSTVTASKTEQKITSDLSASSLCHRNEQFRKIVESYHTVSFQICESVQSLSAIVQKTCVEPLKLYKNYFTNVDAAFHRREQLVQEWRNLSARVKKIDDKERSATNIIKLDKERKAQAVAAQELAEYHELILKDMLLFNDKRKDFLMPSLQALMQSQVELHGNTTRLFTQLIPTPSNAKGSPSSSVIPEDEYQASINCKLAQIRALSIVKS